MRATSPRRIGNPFCCIGLLASLFALTVGCSWTRFGASWNAGGQPAALAKVESKWLSEVLPEPTLDECDDDSLVEARRHFRRGETLAELDSSRCVDHFYEAALISWRSAALQSVGVRPPSEIQSNGAWRLYHQAVGRMIIESQRYGRFDPCSGLEIQHGLQRRLIPIRWEGFRWSPEDFQRWDVVGDYSEPSLTRIYESEGLGVPLVIARRKRSRIPHEADFLPSVAAFNATVVLDPDGTSLIVVNPHESSFTATSAGEFPIARDQSADLAFLLQCTERSPWSGLLTPDDSEQAPRLFLSEPFDPHKIPVVWVHGLLSSPATWSDVVNELRYCSDLRERYQFWFFRYPTGQPFIRAAAELRSQLTQLRQIYDPNHESPELDQIVLVGHSMGGLVSKLLVTHSGDDILNVISKVPLETLQTDEKTRAGLEARVRFEPHPSVRRVVFIATPHHGSGYAARLPGKVADTFIRREDPAFEKLLRDNPGAFHPSISDRLPNSVDLLDPQEPLLDVIEHLPLGSDVTLHSIIGEGPIPLGSRGSDGAVPVRSAVHPGVASELHIAATHNGLLRNEATFAELARILREHAVIHGSNPLASQAAPFRDRAEAVRSKR